jgi:hypothetical protein
LYGAELPPVVGSAAIAARIAFAESPVSEIEIGARKSHNAFAEFLKILSALSPGLPTVHPQLTNVKSYPGTASCVCKLGMARNRGFSAVFVSRWRVCKMSALVCKLAKFRKPLLCLVLE